MARTGRPSPFEIGGGRAGMINYREGAIAAEMEWEMLVGEIEMVIYANGCRWTAPQERHMEQGELITLVQRLADALPGRIEVVFGADSVVVDPRGAA